MILISPIVIEPLFFQFKPLVLEELAKDARALGDRVGVKLERVLEVDASKAAAAARAYLPGPRPREAPCSSTRCSFGMSRSEMSWRCSPTSSATGSSGTS